MLTGIELKITGRVTIWLLYFLGATLFALLTFSIYASSILAERETVPYKKILLYEMTGAYSGMLLFPLILNFMKRFPVSGRNWQRRVPLNGLSDPSGGHKIYTRRRTLRTDAANWNLGDLQVHF